MQLSYQIFVLPRAHHATTVVGAWMQDGNRWDKVYLFRPQSQVQKVLTCLEPSRVKWLLFWKIIHYRSFPLSKETVQGDDSETPSKTGDERAWGGDGSLWSFPLSVCFISPTLSHREISLWNSAKIISGRKLFSSWLWLWVICSLISWTALKVADMKKQLRFVFFLVIFIR